MLLCGARVYTHGGCSQNGMASAYVGRCFADKITGSWIGGGGLFSPGHGPTPPNRAGTCADGCEYWPVFPCHTASAASTVAACVQFYSNDPVTVDQVTHSLTHSLTRRSRHARDAMRCDAMRCDAMRCDAMRCDAMRCDAMRCDAPT